MDLNKYMQMVRDRHAVASLVEAALGLTSEAGEVAQFIRKHEYESHGIKPGSLALELGDVLHYLAQACDYLDISLEELAELNAVKMKALDKGERRNFEAMVALWRWPGEPMHQLIAEVDAMLEEVAR